MTDTVRSVDLSGIVDRQRPVTVVVGLVLVLFGIAGITGVLDGTVASLDGIAGQGSLLLGVFGVSLWLGVAAIVAGLLGIVLSFYAGASTTFNKLAGGLVLPAVFLLAVVDWLLAVGLSPLAIAGAAVALLLAVVLVLVGVVLLYGNALVVVLPVVAVLAIADWVLGLTAMTPADPVTPATLVLLLVLDVVVLLVAFEGGTRLT